MIYTTLYNSEGINRNASSFLNREGEMVDIQNLISTKIGILKKTGDYELKNTQITASKNMLGGVDFVRASGTHTHVVAIDGSSNAGIYIDVGGTWTSQSQSLTKDNKVRFAFSPVLDTLFAVNYADATRSYNGSSWSTSTNVTSCPKAKYVYAFGDRIYVLNCVVGSDSYPARAYRSSTVESSLTWDTTNEWVSFYDVINGVGRNGTSMFVGCENSCWIWTTEDVKYKASGHGCVSHDGIADYGDFTFFPASDGIYAYDGAKDLKISLPVQDFWDAIPTANLSDVQAKVLNHILYVYIGDVTVGGLALTNVVLAYNILQNSWFRLSLSENVEDMHLYTDSEGKKLFFGNDDGEVFELFSSETQNTGVFTSYIETPWYYGSGPLIIDDYKELWGHGKQLSGLKAKYKVDDGGWQSIGELNGFSDIIRFKAVGKRIKFLLEETSKNNLFELHSIEIGFRPRYPETKENKQ